MPSWERYHGANQWSRANLCSAVHPLPLLSRGLLDERQIGGAAKQPASAIEERHCAVLRQALRPPEELLMLSQEFDASASRNAAFWLPLGAGAEVAQPAEVAIRSGLEYEHVDLMRSDANGRLAEERPQRVGPGSAKRIETVEAVKPKREVHILAFMPELDPRAAVRVEARHLLPGFLRDRADQRDRCHFRMGLPSCRHRIRAPAEVAIPAKERFILLLDAPPGQWAGFTANPFEFARFRLLFHPSADCPIRQRDSRMKSTLQNSRAAFRRLRSAIGINLRAKRGRRCDCRSAGFILRCNRNPDGWTSGELRFQPVPRDHDMEAPMRITRSVRAHPACRKWNSADESRSPARFAAAGRSCQVSNPHAARGGVSGFRRLRSVHRAGAEVPDP